jgi:DNA-binding transcriptional LysR family regulator
MLPHPIHLSPELPLHFVVESAHGFPIRAIAEVTSPVEAFDLVAGNAGIVLLPAGVCDDLPPGVRAIRISDISPLETVLIHRSNGSGLTHEFAEHLRVKINLRVHARDVRAKAKIDHVTPR